LGQPFPDDHPLMAGMVGLQTTARYGNASMLAADFVLGIGNRWANRHTVRSSLYPGSQVRACDIRAHPDRPRVRPDLGIVSDARRRWSCSWKWRVSASRPASLPDWSDWAADCQERKRTMLRRPTTTTCRSSRSASTRK